MPDIHAVRGLPFPAVCGVGHPHAVGERYHDRRADRIHGTLQLVWLEITNLEEG